MKITKEWLVEKEACRDDVKYFLEKKLENIEALELIDRLIKDNKLRYANWFIPHLLTHREQVQYAVFAATPAVDIFEKIDKKEKAPREALEAAKNWLENSNEENKKSCKVAVRAAAWAAAEATLAAAGAARAAAWAAAWAAAAATEAAAGATEAANWSAVAAMWTAPEAAAAVWTAAKAAEAAWAAALIKTINHGIKLLKQQKNEE